MIRTKVETGWEICSDFMQLKDLKQSVQQDDNDNDDNDDDNDNDDNYCKGLECPGEWRQVPCDQVHPGRHQLQPPGGRQQGERYWD